MKAAGCALALALLAPPAWAVNKCTGADGRVTFQDAPCAGRGEALDIRPASGMAPPARAQTAPPPPAAAVAPAPAPPAPAAPAVAPARSALERMADRCLDWYKPLLRDPASAYWTEARFEDKRVLRMDLHAKNGFGGVAVRQAACEFDSGRFSADWTKIQAKRLNWSVD